MRKYKTDFNKQSNTINVREEFIPYGEKILDSKNRITIGGKIKKTLGKRLHTDKFIVYIGKNGDILLRPAVSIPSNEAWIYENPGTLKKIRRGLNDAKHGKTITVKNLDSFLNNL
ncbi:MAG: hypothetical protein KA120_03890 [Candidatus Goldbacteria bacterium]|nr:hypothetical protein [Candidatus Goldiibacteriota bacterium]